jgi:uncharacterized protein
MSKFLTPTILEVVTDANGIELKNRDGRQLWRAVKDQVYQSNVAKQNITTPTGFITDLASQPQLTLTVLGECAQEASVPHDFLYSTGLLPRALADAVLREAMIVSGEPSWKAEAFYMAVRIGGSSHFCRK